MDLKSYIEIELRTDTDRKSRKIEQDLNRVDKAAKETGKNYKKSSDQIDKGSKKAAKSVKGLKDESDKTKRGVGSLSGGLKGLAGSLKALPIVGVVASLASLTLAVSKGLSVFKQFDQSIQDLSAITGATGADLDFYSDKAREMGAVTTQTAGQVADAFRLVASAKPDLLESKEALAEVTQQAITLAEAAGIAVPDAANTMASALNQFGASADQAARYTNVLAAGSKFGASSIAEMGESLKFAGVVAGNFGVTFEETNALLQTLGTNAIKGGEAGTQLRGVLLALETKMDKEFRPSVVGTTQALLNLRDANLSAEESQKIFGNRNIAAAQILANNAEAVADLTEKVTGTNIANEQAATRVDTLGGSMARLGSASEELALVLVADSGLGGAFQTIIDKTAESLLGFTDWIKGVDQIDKRSKELESSLVASLTFDEARSQMEAAGQATRALRSELEKLQKSTGGGRGRAAAIQKEAARIKKALEEEELRYNALIGATGRLRIEQERQAQARIDQLEELKKEEADAARARQQGIDDVVSALQAEIDALGQTAEEITFRNALVEAGIEADEQGAESIRLKVAQLYEEKQAIEDSEAATKNRIAAEKEAAKEAERNAEKIRKANEEAAKASEKVWGAWRDTLSDFFFEIAADGADAFDTLVDGFKAMIAKMLAEWAASGIVGIFSGQGFGGFSTGGLVQSGASALSGAGSLTSLFGGGSGASSGLSLAAQGSNLVTEGFNGLSGVYQDVGNIAYDLGFEGAGDLIASGGDQYLNASNTTNAANLGANLVAGYAGSYLGGEVFGGDTTGLGSGVGGMVGSIWGPVGTAIGSFLGEGFEKLLGNVLGFGGQSNNPVYADIAGGTVGEDYYTDNGRHKEQQDAVRAVSPIIQDFINMVGDTDFAGTISASAKHGMQLAIEGQGQVLRTKDGDEFLDGVFERILKSTNGLDANMKELFTTFEGGGEDTLRLVSAITRALGPTSELSDRVLKMAKEFQGTTQELAEFVIAQEIINDFIEETENLHPAIETLIQDFEGTTEELLNYTAALGGLNGLLLDNPVEETFKGWAAGMTESSTQVITGYNSAANAAIDALVAFDGSTESTIALSNALAASQLTAAQMTAGILNLKVALTDMFEGSAKSIREQLMSETELAKSRLNERDSLRQLMDSLTDPEQIRQTAQEIDQLNNTLFGALTDAEKQEFGEEFAQFAESAAEAANARLDETINRTRISQDELLTAVGNTLTDAANKQQEAAARMDEAAEKLLRAAVDMSTYAQTISQTGPQQFTIRVEDSGRADSELGL